MISKLERLLSGGTVTWDRLLVTDGLSPEAVEQITAVSPAAPDRVWVVIDHDTPAGSVAVAEKQKALSGAKKRMEDLDRIIQHIYEDNVLGKLSDSRYLKLSRQYEKEQAEIEQLAVVLEQEIETQAGQVSDVNEFLKLVDKYLDIPELDAAILNELVSKIVVHSPVKENGKKHVQIDLYFTYVGQIRIPLKIGRESLNESEPA